MRRGVCHTDRFFYAKDGSGGPVLRGAELTTKREAWQSLEFKRGLFGLCVLSLGSEIVLPPNMPQSGHEYTFPVISRLAAETRCWLMDENQSPYPTR